jgi:hypothetical protein
MLERRAATWTNQAVLLTGTSSPKWLASFMCCAAVVGRLIALELSVVSQHDGAPKPIVPKDNLTALRLNETMDLIVAPARLAPGSPRADAADAYDLGKIYCPPSWQEPRLKHRLLPTNRFDDGERL